MSIPASDSQDYAQRIVKLRLALDTLLTEVKNLNGYDLTRDVEPYKAQACWDYAIEKAENVLKETL